LLIWGSTEHKSFSRQNYPSVLGKNVIFGGLDKKLWILEVRLKAWTETGMVATTVWKNSLGHNWLLKILKFIGSELLDVIKILVLESDHFV